MQKHKKTWLIIIGIVLVVGLILGWAAWRGSKQNKPQYTTVQAEVGPLKQTVSVVGTVKPLKELALNFLTSGRVSNVAVKVGDSVKAGQLLGELDYSALLLRKNEAEAGLQIAQANLNKLLSGASQQTIAVSQASVEQAVANQKMAQAELDKLNKTVAENIKQAEKTLNDLTDPGPETVTVQEQAVATAQTNLTNIDKTTQENLTNAYNSGLIIFSDKILAAKVALDHINTILTDDDAKYVLSVKDSVYLQRTKDTRILALESYTAASQAVTAARDGSSDSAFTTASDKTKQFLNQTAQALSYAYSMLEATITSNNFSQAKLDNYKSIISGQINQINAAITAAESATQSYKNAKLNRETSLAAAQDNLNQAKVNLDNARQAAQNNLNTVRLTGERQIANAQSQLDAATKAVEVAKAQLENVKAPARAADITLAQGQINQALANLASVQKQIDDSRLVAPLDGVVTQVNYEVGEQFSAAGKPFVTILVNNNFYIEADITEADITKIKIGNPVEITLDAFGPDVIFHGQVYFIDPAQTVIQDVVYYKVKISFSDSQEITRLTTEYHTDIKAGMTANVTIITAERDNVVKVPARAIIDKDNGTKIVRLLKDNQLQEVPVTVGLRDDEGLVEVTSGVNPGDQVVTFIKYPKQSNNGISLD